MFVRGREVKFNLIGSRPFSPPDLYWFAFSGALIVLSLVVLFTMGINLGIEFKGGYLLKVQLERPADVEEVRGILAAYSDQGLDETIVQTGESDSGPVLNLRMPYIEDSQARKDTIDAVTGEIDARYGIEEVLQEEQVGSEWGREVSTKALIALGVFLVVILIYITLRLEFKMAVTAIIALIHDTLITVGIYSLTGRQVTPVTVIAFLTILGYSLYDTIVVFDRVEENTNLMSRAGKISYADIVNESVNQTLMRSIGTTLTTLLPIITILIFGGDTLKDFAFALFLGVFMGAYSSIFIASPLLAIWKEREPRYAAVREKMEARGAKEAILITSPKAVAVTAGAGKAKEAALPEEKDADAVETAVEERKEKAKPAAKPASKPAAPQAQRKKTTTRGPSGGKKKKKKKKR
ncbi:MAG: protein translocase subunit SecF [Actinobacteria bacterium]|jgi:preprotein translocase SecF subunit|nr:MAG: protein translocase subunit SecF [Actinomycetota bacterium]